MTEQTALGSETTQTAEDPAQTPAPALEAVAEPQQQPAEGGETPKAAELVAEGKPEPTKAPGAPTEYLFTPPEGQTFDESVMDAFKTTARELDLTNDGAQSILDNVLPKIQEAADEKLQGLRAEWKELARTDEEYGGAGFQTNVKIANQALDRFGDEEMKSLLIESGLGDHPAFVRAFFRIGKAISEDTILTGGPRAVVEEDLNDPAVQARRMYKSE